MNNVTTWLMGVLCSSCVCFSCVAPQYEPKDSQSAKWVYEGRHPQLAVGAQRANVGPFSSEYAQLLDGEARTVAESSHASRAWGFATGLAGAAAGIASLFIAPNLNDPLNTESTDGKLAVGMFFGSLVIGGVSGYLNADAEVTLNDAINMHNDNLWQLKRPTDEAVDEPVAEPADDPAGKTADEPMTEALPEGSSGTPPPSDAAPSEAGAPATTESAPAAPSPTTGSAPPAPGSAPPAPAAPPATTGSAPPAPTVPTEAVPPEVAPSE